MAELKVTSEEAGMGEFVWFENRVPLARSKVLSPLRNLGNEAINAQCGNSDFHPAFVTNPWSRMVEICQNEAIHMQLSVDRVICKTVKSRSA